jgi:hypothetical protein
MENQVEKRDIKDVLGGIECYTTNLAELIGEVEQEVEVTPDGKIVVDFQGVIDILQIVWNKIKETALECEDKQIEVKLPSGIVGNIIALALGAIGFKL